MGTVFRHICTVWIIVGLLLGPAGASPGYAQAPAAGAGPPAAPLSAPQLEELVGRIALYPDDLLAIVLPAATFPLDLVQADRFLQRLKQDKTLQPDARWDESIRNLLNYPEVVSMMSQDLDWTQNLGEAVVSQQAEVMQAVQRFRAKAATAGNLKSDDKQVIVQEKEVIKIVPANPEVIYVPQYQPATVVVYQAAPVWGYYPTPYPVYYYPYPPGAAFASGFFWGATTAWAFNWGGGHVEHNVNINRTDNININRNNPQNQQRANEARQRAQQPATQPARQQAQQRAGSQGGATTWQSQKRPGEVSGGRVSPSTAASRPGYGSAGATQRSEFGNPGRGSEATRDANRGMQSRSSASTTARGSQPGGAASVGGSAGRTESAATMNRGSQPGGGASVGGGASRGGASGGGAPRGGGPSRGGGGVRRR